MKPGRNLVTIVGSALGESDNEKRTPFAAVQGEDEEGGRLTAYLYLSEGALKFSLEKLEACGWKAEERGYAFEELNGEESPILGNKAEFVCNEEEFEGKMRLKVAFINPPGGGFVERMEPSAATSFAEKLRARIGVSGGGPAGANKRPTPPSASQRKAAAEGDAPLDKPPF